MTYVLLVLVMHVNTVSVTRIEGYRSLVACQAAQTQVLFPVPVRVIAICINGPDAYRIFP